MPQITISKSNFLEVDAYTGSSYLRYRIISEDRNRTSYWSPVFEMPNPFHYIPGTLEAPGSLVITTEAGLARFSWTAVNLYSKDNLRSLGEIPEYDVWVQFKNNQGGEGSWKRLSRVSAPTVDLVIPATYTYLDSLNQEQSGTPEVINVEIHRLVRPVVRYPQDSIDFLQGQGSVNVESDTITLSLNHGYDNGDSIVYDALYPAQPLVSDTMYFVRVTSPSSFTLHGSRSGALLGNDKVNLSETGSGSATIKNFKSLLYKSSVNL